MPINQLPKRPPCVLFLVLCKFRDVWVLCKCVVCLLYFPCFIFCVVWNCLPLIFFYVFFTLKAKRVSLREIIFLSRFDPAIKSEEHYTFWPFLQAFWRDFYHKLSFFKFFFSNFLKIKMLLWKPQGKLKAKCVRVVGVLYDGMYCLCCINVFVLYACCQKNDVLYCRAVFSYYILRVVFLRYIFCNIFSCYIFCVIFWCYIFVLYLCVVFSCYNFCVVFLCYIFCVVFSCYIQTIITGRLVYKFHPLRIYKLVVQVEVLKFFQELEFISQY